MLLGHVINSKFFIQALIASTIQGYLNSNAGQIKEKQVRKALTVSNW